MPTSAHSLGSTRATTVDELIDALKEQLDSPHLRAVLEAVGFDRRVDLTLTLFIDRGIVPKPPRFTVS